MGPVNEVKEGGESEAGAEEQVGEPLLIAFVTAATTAMSAAVAALAALAAVVAVTMVAANRSGSGFRESRGRRMLIVIVKGRPKMRQIWLSPNRLPKFDSTLEIPAPRQGVGPIGRNGQEEKQHRQ